MAFNRTLCIYIQKRSQRLVCDALAPRPITYAHSQLAVYPAL
ncbi:hypothetical protein HMPREF1991_01237 [Hoylesella loescheii DSM 19665 = JCM 12249 = ATCC 15930]|uniref:Uncharacterized protein n=1 Tax=Hoylesella loescheii DSM 19665 = JCM 12249 = ATCC 15930 TaxID=1122985 RepID=A0A069QKY2_HOYLO|nr:hypothetical protein HMPREF1991_01237 [Hoylesella loescheii DSM 19665 = JCM 12249 = ATCC 15930]